MTDAQFWTIFGMLAGGFGWIIMWLRSIDKKINELDKRLTIVETILIMMGLRPKLNSEK